MAKTVSSQTQRVSQFVHKLYSILHDNKYSKYIHWNQSGDIFIIEDISAFTNDVMPKFFKHRNFSSIIRQLNMYGFHKVKAFEYDNAYFNPQFCKGRSEMLKQIHRKGNKSIEQKSIQKQEDKLSNLPDICSLKKQNSLEKACKRLIKENSEFLEQNRKKIQRFQYESRQKNHKMEQLLAYLIMHRSNNNVSLPHRWVQKIQNLQQNAEQIQQKQNFQSIRNQPSQPIIEQENQIELQHPILTSKFSFINQNYKQGNSQDVDIQIQYESSVLSLGDFLDL